MLGEFDCSDSFSDFILELMNAFFGHPAVFVEFVADVGAEIFYFQMTTFTQVFHSTDLKLSEQLGSKGT